MSKTKEQIIEAAEDRIERLLTPQVGVVADALKRSHTRSLQLQTSAPLAKADYLIAAVEVAQRTLSYIHAELERESTVLRTIRELDE